MVLILTNEMIVIYIHSSYFLSHTLFSSVLSLVLVF